MFSEQQNVQFLSGPSEYAGLFCRSEHDLRVGQGPSPGGTAITTKAAPQLHRVGHIGIEVEVAMRRPISLVVVSCQPRWVGWVGDSAYGGAESHVATAEPGRK